MLESGAGAIAAIEVKASAAVTGHDFNGLRAFAEMRVLTVLGIIAAQCRNSLPEAEKL